MEADVRSGAYVEWGKVGGNYYGIRFSAIRKIIASGRTAVLDCQPQTVHLLHQPEFNPCTVFIAAPNFEVAKRMMKDGLENGVTKNNRSPGPRPPYDVVPYDYKVTLLTRQMGLRRPGMLLRKPGGAAQVWSAEQLINHSERIYLFENNSIAVVGNLSPMLST
ncbi:guanylate kinase [Opisthorchis viverrini]|uniref:Guanylate kinase n=1 Tax=Opisthorchis viverrini TaxID=6198 RepID=A0A1S8WZX9_OPIVI|nr:guanylate kinase [Opisthorchis viverrini]